MTAAMGVEAVLSRIAAIEARFGARPPVAAGTPAAPRASFDAALASVLHAGPAPVGALGPAGAGDRPAPAAAGRASGPYAELFDAAGAAHGVDPRLLAAVAQAESGMNPTAVSPAGARGLMQLMPGTAAELGVRDPFDPSQAVDGAARLLRRHLDRFGTVELALAAYNAGPGAVSRHGGVPPYQETQTYIRRVLDRLGAAT